MSWSTRNNIPSDLDTTQREIGLLRSALVAVVRGIICSGSGPIAPCFDAGDWAVERSRGEWCVVDRQAVDLAIRLVDALSAKS